MEFEQFVCLIKEKLNRELPTGTRAKEYCVPANNGSKKYGVVLEEEGEQMSPVIYLRDFYERYREGEDLQEAVSQICSFYRRIKEECTVNAEDFLEFDKIKDRVAMKVIHTERNRQLVETMPHLEVMDLSLVFYLLLNTLEDGTATMQIKREHAERWGIKSEELLKYARENAGRILPAEFAAMEEVMRELTGMETEEMGVESSGMYVLSNSVRNYGASCIFYPHVAEMIGQMLKDNYYIIPSSIHELIIVPESKGLDEDEMNEMIKEVNHTQLAAEEILSEHVYYYDRSECRIKISRTEK